jgi:polyphosphate kinase
VADVSRPITAPEVPRYADDLAEEIEDIAVSGRHEGHRRPQRPDDRFLDREASWLQFNSRVLDLAADPDTPLLERVRFLAIFADNLDEFFMVRVAGLRRRVATGIGATTPAGLTAREQLDLIASEAHALVERHATVFRDEVNPALLDHGVEIVHYDALDEQQRAAVDVVFAERVYPVLTPLAVDPVHPFPYISGLSLNLAVVVRDEETEREHFARVKVPSSLSRFVPVGPRRFVLLEDVMAAHLGDLFPGLRVVESTTFRVTRNEDVEIEEDEVENLLQALERELVRRRFGPAVRLEVQDDASDRVVDLLVRELEIGEAELYRLPGPLDLGALWTIADLDLPGETYERFIPATHSKLRGSDGAPVDFFATLRQGDVLVHHPYDSFATSTQAFIEQAAADPSVLAIKQTLYRTSGDSPVVDALIEAATLGKQVLVLVEIKARFDEQANIRWARALEQAGCHVVYGLVGLKTHCKLCLVVREESGGELRRYAHIGTGNYNPKTARLYEDLGLLTANQAVGADIADLFNHLSGYTKHRDYSTLLVAPDSLRPGLLGLIAREVRHAEAGKASGITMKLNSLVDEQIIDALYDASGAGVPVKLIVRGMCALRPGVPGLSETVQARSILGRFLEHSRVFRFCNDGDDEVWIGSADMMHRNLDRRVEALVRVGDPQIREQLQKLLDRMTDDRIARWDLHPDGEWRRVTEASGRRLADYQELLITAATRRVEARAEAGEELADRRITPAAAS